MNRRNINAVVDSGCRTIACYKPCAKHFLNVVRNSGYTTAISVCRDVARSLL
jgi:hypothetical protein